MMNSTQSEPEKRPSDTALKPGTPAPDFTLHSTPDQTLSLHEFRGQPVVLIFYPADWSPVCGDELNIFNAALPELRKFDAQPLGISVDGTWSHRAYAEKNHIHFPLLSDFEPKGEVSKRYGVYLAKQGESARALFVIDADGIIRWSYVSPTGVNPGVDGVLDALEDMMPEKQVDGQAQ